MNIYNIYENVSGSPNSFIDKVISTTHTACMGSQVYVVFYLENEFAKMRQYNAYINNQSIILNYSYNKTSQPSISSTFWSNISTTGIKLNGFAGGYIIFPVTNPGIYTLDSIKWIIPSFVDGNKVNHITTSRFMSLGINIYVNDCNIVKAQASCLPIPAILAPQPIIQLPTTNTAPPLVISTTPAPPNEPFKVNIVRTTTSTTTTTPKPIITTPPPRTTPEPCDIGCKSLNF